MASSSASTAKKGHTYTIGGVKVEFPVKAYPSQVAMMSKIISALQKGQNSLLESPTGSGKSLALLCAALAWQKQERARAEEYNRAVEAGLIEPETAPVTLGGANESGNNGDGEESGDEYFQPGDGFFIQDPDNPENPEFREIPLNTTEKKIKKKRVPKIYFGTRTHRQITQIVRELKKTGYNKGVRMSILASRDHTCIHPSVSKLKNRNEGCRELTDRRPKVDGTGGGGGQGCTYQGNVKSKLASHHSVNAYKGNDDAWDLEDLVKVGKKVRACPYYATRELKDKSDIIFCPYNYLVEPLIRKSMMISLKNNVVILDEAHNIEDSARSAASWEVTQEAVQDAMKDFEGMLESKSTGQPDAYTAMVKACSNFSKWMDQHSDRLNDYQDYNSRSKVWNGTEIVGELNFWELGPEAYPELRRAYQVVEAEAKEQDFVEEMEEEMGHKSIKPRISTGTLALMEGFFTVINYLYMHDMKHRDDYRVALVKTQSRKPLAPQSQARAAISGWLSKSSPGPKSTLGTTLKANFWCLNPAVCFGDIKEDVRSIVLTSGTLSPMASFSSELAVKFPIQLEANHVVDKKQVWIAAVSHGPTGHCLNATYKNTESFAFQDEMGRLTLSVCQRISRGVLLFLPSYAMLTKLSERWMQTGLWQEIGARKVIVVEPRYSDEFEAAMRQFYEVIESTGGGKDGDGSVNGALFIAVCRGKVSEGLDFADDNARAVICLGIPFPNIKDVQVDLKKKYNDKRRTEDKDILTGNDWYEIQAFRALNQALGRCIRHRDDWGAIIMVDDRYAQRPKYVAGLSKWVRSSVVHFSDCNQMTNRLEEFSQEMRQFDVEKAKFREEEELLRQEQERQQAALRTPPSGGKENSTLSDNSDDIKFVGSSSSEKTAASKKKSAQAKKRQPSSKKPPPQRTLSGKLKAKMEEESPSGSEGPWRNQGFHFGNDASRGSYGDPDGLGKDPAMEGFKGFLNNFRKSEKRSVPDDESCGLVSKKKLNDDDDDEVQILDQTTSPPSTEDLQAQKKLKFSFKPVTSTQPSSSSSNSGSGARSANVSEAITPSSGWISKPKPIQPNAKKAKTPVAQRNTVQYDSDDDFV